MSDSPTIGAGEPQIGSRIFLSYARGDDEPFVKRLYEFLTAQGFDVWWDRVSMPSRNLTFHQEIRDAVAACDRLVLVVGPQAGQSEYVTQEWQFAWYQADKVVTPILRIGDYPVPIDELRLLHCEDFRDDADFTKHAELLAQKLSDPPPPLGKLIAVPELPQHFLARSERLQAVRDALRADLDGPHVIGGTTARIGMHGMGGIGKSVLASAVAHDRLVRHAFPDGIVWVSVGALPGVAELQRRVHRHLGGDGNFETPHEGKEQLKEVLTDKAVLLILDDVWRRADVDAFNVLGPRCRAMITTRDAGLLTALGGTHHVVELLTDEEALRLLASETGISTVDLPAEAEEVVSECGRLPLAVALCGALVRDGKTWQSVLQQLQQARIDRIADRYAVEEHHKSVWHAIHIGVEALEPDQRERFLELAVFPTDEATPEAAAAVLWSHTGNLDDWDSDELLTMFAQRSLVQTAKRSANDNSQFRRFWLHDLIYDYARQVVGDLKPLHEKLLAAYQQRCPDGWSTGPNDGYFFNHLCQHLTAINDWSALETVLTDLGFLEAKVAAGLAFDLPRDFGTAAEHVPTDLTWTGPDDSQDWKPLEQPTKGYSTQEVLLLLEKAIRRDIHFIARHTDDYPQALFQCLWNTCWWYDCREASKHYIPPEGGWTQVNAPWTADGPKLHQLLERWRKERRTQPFSFWLRSMRPLAVDLRSAQLGVFLGHIDHVNCVAFSPDGRRLVSGASDKTIRVWDVITGKQITQFERHTGAVNSVAFSPDGTRIVSGSSDFTVRVWDVHSGKQITQLERHTGAVNSVAFSPDGTRIVSGSSDFTVRVWDVHSGKQITQFEEHSEPISSVAFSPDGVKVVSAGGPIAAFGPDGTQIVSGAGHNILG